MKNFCDGPEKRSKVKMIYAATEIFALFYFKILPINQNHYHLPHHENHLKFINIHTSEPCVCIF